MIALAAALANPRYSNGIKCLALLDFLGGTASTAEIKSAGAAHGLRAIKGWSVASLFSPLKGRVTRLPDGWLLLPEGREHLQALIGPFNHEPNPHLGSNDQNKRHTVFVGHGGSPLWRELKDFLRDKMDVDVVEFNSVNVVGLSTKERLSAMLDSAHLALVVMTAEDERSDGSLTARSNVIHEIGLFQGRLGFEKAAIMLEDGCEEFSNIHGIVQIRFPRGRISAEFEQVRDFLNRELKVVQPSKALRAV